MKLRIEKIVSHELEIKIPVEDIKKFRSALAEECERRFETETPAQKIIFDFLADVEFELRKNCNGQ